MDAREVLHVGRDALLYHSLHLPLFCIWSLPRLLRWLLSMVKFSAANSVSEWACGWTCSSCIFLHGVAEESKGPCTNIRCLVGGVEDGSMEWVKNPTSGWGVLSVLQTSRRTLLNSWKRCPSLWDLVSVPLLQEAWLWEGGCCGCRIFSSRSAGAGH